MTGVTLMPMPKAPTARSAALASWLRELRTTGTDLSTTAVAEELGPGWSQSKVSRIETAQSGVTRDDLAQLLDLYGASSAARALLEKLHAELERRGWWTEYGDIWGDNPYLVLEDLAVRILEWQAQNLPGLLQTAAYSRAVITAANPNATQQQIETMVRARLGRKPLLDRENAPMLDAIIDEAVFRRGMADPDVMVPQVRALLDTPRHVSVRVLPFSASWHAGTDSSMTILSFGPGLLDKPYIEGVGGALYIESATGIARCQEVWTALDTSALSPEESREWLSALLEE